MITAAKIACAKKRSQPCILSVTDMKNWYEKLWKYATMAKLTDLSSKQGQRPDLYMNNWIDSIQCGRCREYVSKMCYGFLLS